MNENTNNNRLVEIEGVSKRFVKSLDFAGKIAQKLGANIREEVVRAVDDANIYINRGEVVGLVGESGCGKSTLGRMVAGIMKPTEGIVRYDGKDIYKLEGNEARDTALKTQMIFQDPFASLNPRMRMQDIIGEAAVVHGICTRQNFDEHVDMVLDRCGLDPEFKRRYPHQFSGGQRQRIGIARALSVNPECIVCDESVAALDVSIQAQILNLFMKLREELDLTYLFISHDIGVVEHISDRIIIMYLGRVVESGTTDEIFASPNHPYTQVLLREVPSLETRHHQFKPVDGEIPSPIDPPSGCYFHPRCPHATDRCKQENPKLRDIAPGRTSACHLNDG
ncbi:MAG: ATP-binding cassette domain-containing protein [Rhodospirillales bacterium]|jgi:peptide/nickel transport system ATP-binding protein|nr:ATP-binding cassette domain-containing protein [Rhodospirillales bacterium]